MDYKITNKTIDKLKYDLVREGLLDYSQLIEAVESSRDQQTNLGQILIQNNIIKENALLNFLEKKLHIPYVNLDDYTLDPSVAQLISEPEARKYKIVPLFIIEDTLTIAMADPLDLFALNNISLNQNYKVEPVICSERNILNSINQIYNPENKVIQQTLQITQKVEPITKYSWQNELNEEKTDEVNMYKLVRAIINQAIQENTSDIHLDPQQNELLVRFRIDGILYNRGSIPILLVSNFISRIKSASGLSLEENLLPQTGRLEVNIDDEIINTRVSTFPTNFGERFVIKIFTIAPNINKLGFEPSQLEMFKKELNKNNGIIIGSASSGNGQNTTFYSIIEYLNNENNNIMTIESPIRYNIDKVNQTQINTSTKFYLENAIKHLNLQDPDIIYLNEINDKPTIEFAIKAALSNKLVLTTLNSNNAIDIIYNLLYFDINPNLIASSLNATFNQKLIRTLCTDCKTETNLDTEILTKLKLPSENKYFKANGCKNCNNTGYKGRTAVFEILINDKDVKQSIIDKITKKELSKLLTEKNYKTLLDSALLKLRSGITSIEEIKPFINY